MIQRTPLIDMAFTKLIFLLKRAYNTRETPINNAKVHGPAKSPIVFETCKPDSAKADAHWLIDNSDAPAQTISSKKIQKVPIENKFLIDNPLSSCTN